MQKIALRKGHERENDATFPLFRDKKGPAIFCSVSDWTHVGTFITAQTLTIMD